MAKQIKKLTKEERDTLNKSVCKGLRKIAKVKVIDDKIVSLTKRVKETIR